MKKILILVSLLLGTSAGLMAQSRAVGLRIGATGIDASYQYEMSRTTFFQGELGMDFGSSGDAGAGFKAVGTYNIVWARPAWTDMGTWAIYAGPGAALGYVGDRVTYKSELSKIKTRDHGFMFAIAAQAGIEYNFEFPLQLSADIRPYFGIHAGHKTGFYNRGLYGFIPTLSARYRF